MKNQVVSLFDFLGLTLDPWAEAGWDCHAYDLKTAGDREERGIHFHHWDASLDLLPLVERHRDTTLMVCGFPPCTDLAISGTRHWVSKEMENPGFQARAMDFVFTVSYIGEAVRAPIWWLENPVGVIPRFWRDADFWFNPCDYGGYLPENDRHPLYPHRIPPRDAYEKKTGLWTSAEFLMPPPLPVTPYRGRQGSVVQSETGGKEDLTKEIRSATPRGFAQAVYLYNRSNTKPASLP